MPIIFRKLSNGSFRFFFIGLPLPLSRFVFSFFGLGCPRVSRVKQVCQEIKDGRLLNLYKSLRNRNRIGRFVELGFSNHRVSLNNFSAIRNCCRFNWRLAGLSALPPPLPLKLFNLPNSLVRSNRNNIFILRSKRSKDNLSIFFSNGATHSLINKRILVPNSLCNGARFWNGLPRGSRRFGFGFI